MDRRGAFDVHNDLRGFIPYALAWPFGGACGRTRCIVRHRFGGTPPPLTPVDSGPVTA